MLDDSFIPLPGENAKTTLRLRCSSRFPCQKRFFQRNGFRFASGKCVKSETPGNFTLPGNVKLP